MANWMKILAQAIGGKPRKQGGGWHDKWTYEDLMRPDNGEDADPIMFDRFRRQPTTQEQLDAWDRVNQAGPNPMPKLRVKDGKWDPEMVKEMDAWQQRQKEIESQPGYKYEPPLLNGAATQRLKEIATQAVSRQNDEDGRIDTLYSTPTDDPNTVTRPRVVESEQSTNGTRPRWTQAQIDAVKRYDPRNDPNYIQRYGTPNVVNESPNVDPNANQLPSSQRNLDGDIAAMEASIRDAYNEPINNRKANWMQKMGRGLRKFQAGWNGGKGGLVGGFSAALDPTLDERMNRQQQLNDMFAQYGNLRKMKEAEQNDALKQEQIDAIPANRALREMQIRGINEDRDARRAGTAQRELFKAGYFDPTNPVHAKLAQEAGLDPSTLKGWDFRNPNVRKIGGIDYQYDRNNGAWSPINVDSNKLRAYDVIDQNGVVQRYMIPEEKAAQFAQQMRVLGTQIQARSDLADKNNAASMARTSAQINARMAELNTRIKAKTEQVKANPADVQARQELADMVKEAEALRNQ